MSTAESFFASVGGEPTFRKIVTKFYELVEHDEVLRPLYPEADLGPAADRLTLFLMQYWGGPHTYSEQRGHPRLRMRHAPFKIGPLERDAWLKNMRIAVDEAQVAEPLRAQLWEYLEMAAQSLMNAWL